MTTYYVRSTNGTSGDGLSWATAFLTLAEAAAVDAAGDTIYVSHQHAETSAASITLALAGTALSPVRILCVNDATGQLAKTATVTTTGNTLITITGSVVCYGISWFVGTGSVNAVLGLNSSTDLPQYYEECSFSVIGTNSGGKIQVGIASNNNGSSQKWKNCNVRFNNIAQTIAINGTRFRWTGGSYDPASSLTTSLFSKSTTSVGRASNVLVECVDLSGAPTAMNLVANVDSGSHFVVRNCKAPLNWTGGFLTTSAVGSRVEVYNFDYADTNYMLNVVDDSGVIRTEKTIVRTGGANDGTSSQSWKVTAYDGAGQAYTTPLESPEINRWNSTVDVPVTVTVDILHDSLTKLTDGDVWLSLQYLGNAGFPLGVVSTDAKANILSSVTDQESSTATWTTTGLTNPNKQKLSVTFTPREAGYLQAKVVVGKANTTLYIDPKLQVT